MDEISPYARDHPGNSGNGPGTELESINRPPIPALPTVGLADLYGALLADAPKETTRKARESDMRALARFLGVVNPEQAAAVLVSGEARTANAIVMAYTSHMRDNNKSPATINRRISTLRRLVRLAQV